MKIKKNVLIRKKVEGTYTWEICFFRPKAMFAFARLVCSQEFNDEVELKKDMEKALKDLGITQEEYDRRMAKHGSSNWYDWTIRNWGIKD